MPYLTYEVRLPGKDWRSLQAVYPHDLPGSAVDRTGNRGDVILFSCMGPTSVITRAVDAASSVVDVAPFLRTVRGSRMETLAQISNGQSYERDMQNSRGLTYRARWTHHG